MADTNQDQKPQSLDEEKSDNRGEDQQEAKQKKPPMSPARKAGIAVLATAALLVLIVGVALWLIHASHYEDTDDAQVNGHIHSVAARVEGTVAQVRVENNQSVSAGEPLVDLDPRDYQVAFEQSNARLLQAKLNATAAPPNLSITRTSDRADTENATADVSTARAMLAASENDVAQAQAKLRQSEANDVRAQNDLARYKILVDKDEVSRQEFDQYLATARAQQAAVDADTAAVASAKQAVLQRAAALRQQQTRRQETIENAPRQEQIKANDIKSQQAGVVVASTAVERDQLNLNYTHILAPSAGVITLRSAEAGDRVSPGQRLMEIVETDKLWVDANFKETQLRKMHVGQHVEIKVDALNQIFSGTIEAMPAATGDRSSLFPAENATGNFVKVVERLPVRIRLESGQKDLDKLRPGMSVEPKVTL